MYSDGYKYWLAYKKNKTSYYRCARYKTLCPGRCVVDDTKIRNCTEHNHPPEPDRVLIDKFRKVLTQRASVETTDLYTIYWEEASQRHSDAALLYTFAAAESAMRKARRKQLPQPPTNLRDLGKFLNNSNMFRIHSGSRRDPFYQTTLTINEDTTCVILMHLKTIEAIGHIEEIHINDAIDSDPNIQLSHHLLIVHAVQNYCNIPILYAITTGKTQAIYAAIFAYIRENLSMFITPSTIMSDFDPETQLALAYTFPDASIKGYWFYYTDTILRYMKGIGMPWDKGRSNTSSGLRMLMVLPLLPAEYMIPGLHSIRKWAREKGVFTESFERLCLYVEHNWLRSVGADKMSIFGLTHGVYNYVQHFNIDFRNMLGSMQPSIWNLLECITNTAIRTYVKCSKSQSVTKAKPSKNQKVLETIVKNATQMWIRTPIHLRNPLQFLQLTSHCINDTAYYSMETTTVERPSVTHEIETDEDGEDNVDDFVHLKVPSIRPNDNNSKSVTVLESKVISQSNQIPNNGSVLSRAIEIVKKSVSEPPPLAFYPKRFGQPQKPIIFSATQPPPLVPIVRNFS